MITVEGSVVDSQPSRALMEDRYAGESYGEIKSWKRAYKREGKRWEVAYDKLVISVWLLLRNIRYQKA